MSAVLPLSALSARSPGSTGTQQHPPWCTHHSAHGCLGEAFTLPGTGLRVWLSAPTAGDTRLVVDGPGGYGELPVVA